MSSKTTRFERLLEAVPDALVGMDQKGVISFVNRQTESLFGYDRDELIGQPIEILVPEPLWQIYAAHREDYFSDPRTRSSGLELVLNGQRKGGTEFPANITMSHIDTGDVLLVVTAVGDVDKQRKAVKDAELIAAIVEYSDDAIIGGTLEGIVTGWNPAAERLYGYSGREMIGRSGSLLTPADRAGEFSANLALIKDGHVIEHFETMRVRKDGSEVPISLTVAPIRDEDGAIVGVSEVHRDVTEQRKALAVAQRLAAIVEGSDDAILGRTLDGIITSWNPAAARMFGYSSEEIIGKSAEVLIPDDRKSEAKADVAAVSAGQHLEQIDTKLIRKDGTTFPVLLTVSPIRTADDMVIGVSVIARDMTEREQAALYARSLLDAAMDPLVTISPEGKIVDVNEATAKVTGIPRDRLIGTDFSHYFTDPDKAHEGYQKAFEQGSVTDYPLTLRHRDGALTDVLYNASVYRDTTGNVLGVFAAARDVTRQKEAFEAAQHIAAIVESSDDAIIGRTLDGTVTSWNPAAERIFGYSSKEIVGKSIDLLSPADRAGETISFLAKISAGLPVTNFETIRIRKDGTAITVSLTISPIRDECGAVVGASVICRDVTKLKHAAQYARSLIEAALDPLVTISPEGKITDLNEATVNVTGFPRKQLIGTDFSYYFTDPDKANEGYRQAFEQGSVTDYPLSLRHRDGTMTEVFYNASVYRDATGNVMGVFAAARDMTKQKEAFEAAQRMMAIIEYSDDAIVGSTLDGIITSWNPAAERMYGYSGEKIVGRSIDLLTPKDQAGEIKAILASVKQGRPVDNVETICIRKDGSAFPVKLTTAPIHDPEGAVVGASAIARDVTEEKQLLAADQQIAAIVQGSDEAIFSRTLDGTVTSWNPAAERMYGYGSEEIIGRTMDLTIPKDRASEAKSIVDRVSAGQHVERLETIRVRKDGTLFPVSITVSPIRDAHGAVVGASAIARDMTGQSIQPSPPGA